MTILYKEDLDKLKCGKPGCNCDAFVMNQQCHPDEGVRSIYYVATGCLHLFCVMCRAEIAVIRVAAKPKLELIKQKGKK